MHSDVELNEIGILKRREIEVRILAPVLEALGQEFGRDKVLEITRKAIISIAHRQGRELATHLGKNDLSSFGSSLESWSKDGALELRVVNESQNTLDFDVTDCRYADLYRSLGLEELGSILSCSRDAAFAEGFNEDMTLTRTRTIMQGASSCDFRFKTASDGTGTPPS
jgi:hypothetical protein